jgi:glycosyltransferase involved in cell wall biosynthesis
MNHKKVSVIIPAYNQANFLGDAIQSVLNQTYKDFELIIVNDASPDNTSQIVKQFNDPRIIYLVHEKNKMLPATRNTGIRASSGEIIALLDADDIYHPEKLEKHVNYLDANPAVGVTYNPRFVLNHSSNTIRDLVRPPWRVNLEDLVLGFPFAPSDMVVRRDWLFQVGLFDETFTSFSEDLDINCQLALAGCEFASVDKALNYRRYHSGRVMRNIANRLNAALTSLNKTFFDPRCPDSVSALRETAFMNHYLVWSYTAFSQSETALGQEYIREALHLNPSLVLGKPSEWTRFLANYCSADENVNHESLLRQIFDQLPNEVKQVNDQYDWAVAHGYLRKAISAIFWGRRDEGRVYFTHARHLNAIIDSEVIGSLSYQLISFANEYGSKAASEIIKELSCHLGELAGSTSMRLLKGNYYFNLAFQDYRAGRYKDIREEVVNALINQPKHFGNRGIWKVLFHSILRQVFSVLLTSRHETTNRADNNVLIHEQ